MSSTEKQQTPYKVIDAGDGAFIKAWTRGVEVDPGAEDQLRRVARLPFIHKWVAVMPDAHVGKGATIGSVVPTDGAIIPAAVGVDLGCGMVAAHTTLNARDLPDDLAPLRAAIERAVPHGRTANGDPRRDRGAWGDREPTRVTEAWKRLRPGYDAIVARHPKLRRGADVEHLGTLGTGNHFIEVCLDEADGVWFMLHSGSRGVGNRIGTYFIEKAKEDMRRFFINLPDQDLAYLSEGSQHFTDYVEAVGWAQDYAAENRRLMMEAVIDAAQASNALPPFRVQDEVVNCHHNYVAREHHFGKNVWVTRKARCGRGRTTSGSSRARWGRARTSCAASATTTPSTAAATGRGGSCRARRRARSSRSPTTPPRPPGSSAARTRTCSTRRRARTSRSRP